MFSGRLPFLQPLSHQRCAKGGPRRGAHSAVRKLKAYRDTAMGTPNRFPEVVGPQNADVDQGKDFVTGGHPEFSSFFEKYELEEEIGRGSYGIVYSGSELGSTRKVAVKQHVNSSQNTASGAVNSLAKKEVEIMRALQDCPSAVQLHGLYNGEREEENLYIVMELCTGGDLDVFTKEGTGLTEVQAAYVANEVLRLLCHCHHNRILHGDVKAGNFVLRSEDDKKNLLCDPASLNPGWLKGIDYGTGQHLGMGKITSRVGTPTHWAPEVFGRRYSKEADLWSLGVMIYLLAAGRLPYCDVGIERGLKTESDLLRLVLSAPVDFTSEPWTQFSDQGKDFIRGLLSRDSRARMTAGEALEHPWIRMHMSADQISLNNSRESDDGCVSCYL